MFFVRHKTSIAETLFLYVQHRAAQHCFAADAAGAAPELGAILRRGGRAIARAGRWRSPAAPLKAGVGHSSALPLHPLRNTNKRCTRGYKITRQKAGKIIEV